MYLQKFGNWSQSDPHHCCACRERHDLETIAAINTTRMAQQVPGLVVRASLTADSRATSRLLNTSACALSSGVALLLACSSDEGKPVLSCYIMLVPASQLLGSTLGVSLQASQ